MKPSVTKMDILEYKDWILSCASGLKRGIYKSWLTDKNIARNNIFEFLSNMNGILKGLDDNINEINLIFKRPLSEVTEVKIKFDEIKDFVYGEFDYPSVLQFADGLYMGMSKGEFDTPTKINDFYHFTARKAFANMPTNPDDLVNEIYRHDYTVPSSVNYDLSSYKTISNWSKLFPFGDRKIIYDAAGKVLNFIYENKNVSMGIVDSMMEVHAIISIVDYIAHTLLVYACRIYAIYSFSLQFVEENIEVKESVDIDASVSGEDPRGDISYIFQVTDELIIRDPNKFDEFLNRFYRFIEKTYGRKISKDIEPKNFDIYNINKIEKYTKTNRFIKVLKDLHIYKVLEEVLSPPMFNTNRIDERKVKLVETLLNPKHAISTKYSARHEFLHIFKGVYCNYYDLEDCRDCALDLYVATLVLGRDWLSRVNLVSRGENVYDIHDKMVTSTESLLSSFYSEIMMLIAQRSAYLERVINAHLKKELDEQNKLFQIHTPMDTLRELIDSAPDATLCAAPDTTRIPYSLEQIYHLPAFEYFEFCDDLLKTDPIFKELPYFTEAVEGNGRISELINKILAMIDGIFTKAKNLFSSNKFKAAQEWVVKHKEKLLMVKFDKTPPAKEDVFKALNYKETIGTGNVVNIAQFKSFMDSTKIEDAIKDVAKWKEDCYKSLLTGDLANIFISDNVKGDKAKVYKNMLLYKNANINTIEPPSIMVNDNNKLMRLVTTWVSTVEDASKLTQQFTTIQATINQITNNLKSKVVTYTNNTTPKPENKEDKEAKENDVKIIKTNDDQASEGLEVGGLVSAYHEVIANAFMPLIYYTEEAILNQYKYIQFIYNKSNK